MWQDGTDSTYFAVGCGRLTASSSSISMSNGTVMFNSLSNKPRVGVYNSFEIWVEYVKAS
jgi:hypothetical protein